MRKVTRLLLLVCAGIVIVMGIALWVRSEEHTSELQSPCNLVCRLLLEKKKCSQTTCSPCSPSRSARPVLTLLRYVAPCWASLGTGRRVLWEFAVSRASPVGTCSGATRC